MGSISIQAANVYIEHQPYLNGKRTRYDFRIRRYDNTSHRNDVGISVANSARAVSMPDGTKIPGIVRRLSQLQYLNGRLDCSYTFS
jgi:hypothetical protein